MQKLYYYKYSMIFLWGVTMVGLISAIFIIAGRFIVKIFITVFGWAMVIFFGKMPEEKNKKLAIMAILSLVWIILIIGITYPALTKAFYDYIPVQELKRMVSFYLESVGIFLIPIIVGIISVVINGFKNLDIYDFLKVAYKGYYYTTVMGIAMIFMLVYAPFITVRRYLKRLHTSSLHVVVEKEQIQEVIEMIKKNLEPEGYFFEEKKPNLIYRLPILLLKEMLMDILQLNVSRDIMLKNNDINIMINYMDIIIEGKKTEVNRVKSKIANLLSTSNIFMTWGKESNKIEQNALEIYNKYLEKKIEKDSALNKLEDLIEFLPETDINYEEWHVLMRKLYLFENIILKYEIMGNIK